MMLRFVLFLILFIVVARVFWRVVDNVIEAASGRLPGEGREGRRGGSTSAPAAQMARDPVCGTFVLPDRAVSIAGARGRVYFCSEACRDKYRAAQGRTA